MHLYISILLRFALLALMAFVLEPIQAHAEKNGHVLIIVNSTDEPYQQTIAGFKEQLKTIPKLIFTELTLAQAKADVSQLDKIKPNLIYSLGAEATQWISLNTADVPIIATLVLKEEDLKKSANVTGVSLNYSLKTQFEWLKKFFIQQKTVAILYNPKENAGVIEIAKAVGGQFGFNLVAIPVASPKELPFALGQLANNIEILLAVPDETVMSVNTAKEVLLASFRNKVPLVGLSDNWVKSGAFYTLSWDYEDLGRQCAEMAQKIMGGAPITAISPEHPRKITYTINAKIAEHMKIDIPLEIIKNAKKIFY